MNYKNKLMIDTEEQRKLLKRAIEFHEETRGYFFAYPQSSANQRRRKEEEMNKLAVNTNSIEINELLKTKTKHYNIAIVQDYQESCKNVYVVSHFYLNGEKTTIKRIKNIFNHLEK